MNKRCATYVRARKQLQIKEAPNILTIVLKRFQVLFCRLNQCMHFKLLDFYVGINLMFQSSGGKLWQDK